MRFQAKGWGLPVNYACELLTTPAGAEEQLGLRVEETNTAEPHADFSAFESAIGQAFSLKPLLNLLLEFLI